MEVVEAIREQAAATRMQAEAVTNIAKGFAGDGRRMFDRLEKLEQHKAATDVKVENLEKIAGEAVTQAFCTQKHETTREEIRRIGNGKTSWMVKLMWAAAGVVLVVLLTAFAAAWANRLLRNGRDVPVRVAEGRP